MIVFDDIEFLYFMLELLAVSPSLFRRFAVKLVEVDRGILITAFSSFLRNKFGWDKKYLELLLDSEFSEFLQYSSITKDDILKNFE